MVRKLLFDVGIVHMVIGLLDGDNVELDSHLDATAHGNVYIYTVIERDRHDQLDLAVLHWLADIWRTDRRRLLCRLDRWQNPARERPLQDV